jgi:hypothetical protein
VALFAFVTQPVSQPIVVFATTFGTNYTGQVSLCLKMQDTGFLIGKTFGEIKNAHICFSINY